MPDQDLLPRRDEFFISRPLPFLSTSFFHYQLSGILYLSVNPRRNENRLNRWVSEDSRRTRQSLALKTYDQSGQAREVLQAARKPGMEVGVIGNLIRLLTRVMTPQRSKG